VDESLETLFLDPVGGFRGREPEPLAVGLGPFVVNPIDLQHEYLHVTGAAPLVVLVAADRLGADFPFHPGLLQSLLGSRGGWGEIGLDDPLGDDPALPVL
jgi:hypothetical protein